MIFNYFGSLRFEFIFFLIRFSFRCCLIKIQLNRNIEIKLIIKYISYFYNNLIRKKYYQNLETLKLRPLYYTVFMVSIFAICIRNFLLINLTSTSAPPLLKSPLMPWNCWLPCLRKGRLEFLLFFPYSSESESLNL
jgi:hypothetical protein